jgi:hypothetical protein
MNYKSKLLLGAALFGLAAGGAGVGIALAKKPEEALASSGTATFTNASVASNVITLTSSGTTPTGMASSCGNTYNNKNQISSGKVMTYTFSSLGGIDITNITLNAHSNSGAGAGTVQYALNGGSATDVIGTADADFKSGGWSTAYGTAWVNVSKTVSISSANSLVVTIACTTNSIYINSLSFTWSGGGAAKTVSSIAVTTEPTKTTYEAGEVFDATGLVVTATYSDSSTAVVTGYTLDPADGSVLATVGTQTITVTFSGVTTTFAVTVTASSVTYPYTFAKADLSTETQIAADGATSVTGCLVKYGASTLGETANQETWYADYTYSTLATDTASLPYVGSLDSSKGLQFGTTKHPFANLSFTSGLFCAHQGVTNEYNITKITVDTATASGNNGVATLDVSVNGTAIGSKATLTSTSTVYTFTPASAVSGHVKLDFNNPGTTLAKQAAIYIKNVKIYAQATVDTNAMLSHLAQDLELLDTCAVTSATWTAFKAKTESVGTYEEIFGAYGTELQAFNLYDYAATGTGARARTATVNAKAKYDAIAAQVAASGAIALKDQGDTTSIAAIASLSILALLGAGYFVLIRRRKEN